MKKMIVLSLFLLLLAACAEDSSTKSEDNNISANEPASEGLDAIVDHFADHGFEIGDKTVKAAEMIGAVDGFGIALNGEDVELYMYEVDSEDLANIQENGEYDMDGFIIPALANGNIILVGYDDHPDSEAIIEAFEDF